MSSLLSLAKACRIAYETDTVIRDKECQEAGLSFADQISVADSDVVILKSPRKPPTREIIFAFRGTQFSDLHVADIVRNFYTVYGGSSEDNRVEGLHGGYARAASLLYPHVLEHMLMISDLPDLGNVYMTGHSQGGAVSTIVLAMFLRNLTRLPLRKYTKLRKIESSISNVTFGAPKPGGRVLWSMVSEKTVRVVNSEDFAPQWPYFRFSQGGSEVVLPNGNLAGLWKMLPVGPGRWAHSIDRYIENLKASG